MTVTFLVTGATGVQGGAAVRELLRVGAKVHALVRDPTKPAAKELEALGAVLVVGDFMDAESVRKAVQNVKGIFLNPFPDMTDPESERKQVERFLVAARAAGTVDTVVISTSMWVIQYKEWLAEEPHFPLKNSVYSKFMAEEAVRQGGIKYWTILRPPWLLQNYFLPMSTLHFPELPSTGEAISAIDPNLPFHQLAGSDAGRFGAAALLDPERFHGMEINLSLGAISLAEAFREIEAVLGVKIPLKFIEPSAVSKHPVFGDLRGVIGQWLNTKGAIANEHFQLQHNFDIKLTGLREYFEQHKTQLRATLPSAE